MSERSSLGSQMNRDRGNFGQGAYVKQMPAVETAKFKDFAGGFNVSDSEEDVNIQSSPDMFDIEVSRRDFLVKAPGTVVLEDLTGHVPKQVALHASLDFRSDIILFDPPYLGVKSDTSTQWLATSMPAVIGAPYFWATYGDAFAFANGVGPVRVRNFGETNVTDYPLIPNGASFAVFADRFIVGGAVIDGTREEMAYAYSGTEGFDKFDYDNDLGSGFEYLVNGQAVGDAIVALRPMGLDMIAFLCRKSVWIGRRTGDLDRPIDVTPRVTGKGAINETCALTVYGGVMYLGDEGVELFDGNDSQHISFAIDDELLPIDPDKLSQYNASYNPSTQYYYLYTPDRTYVFDIVRKRWYRRSLKALGGVPFAAQLSSQAWDQVNGTWDSQTGKSWGSFAGGEAVTPRMVFLGVDQQFSYTLHEESYLSYSNLGQGFLPYWTTTITEDTRNIQLATTKAIRLRYRSGGSVNLWLPDNSGEFAQVNMSPIVLAESLVPVLVNRRSMFTGLGIGVRVQFTDGTPEIIGMELDVLRRGMRVAPDVPFVPREYQADF